MDLDVVLGFLEVSETNGLVTVAFDVSPLCSKAFLVALASSDESCNRRYRWHP